MAIFLVLIKSQSIRASRRESTLASLNPTSGNSPYDDPFLCRGILRLRPAQDAAHDLIQLCGAFLKAFKTGRRPPRACALSVSRCNLER